jgi:hypothetical protein
MGKDDKILKLVQHCDHYLRFDELLKHVAEHNPNQYANFAPRLRQAPTLVEPEPPVREGPPALTSTRPGTRAPSRWTTAAAYATRGAGPACRSTQTRRRWRI